MGMHFDMSQNGTPSKDPAKGLRLTGKDVKGNKWVLKSKKTDK